MTEENKRSIIKSISWRITGSLDTFVLAFLITGKITHASAISVSEVLTKVILYYLHERGWNKILWGKKSATVWSFKDLVDRFVETFLFSGKWTLETLWSKILVPWAKRVVGSISWTVSALIEVVYPLQRKDWPMLAVKDKLSFNFEEFKNQAIADMVRHEVAYEIV
jgi:uncharacterized membrane protein